MKKSDLRLINLETSITKSDDYWQGKEIHYRMHPQNIDCLTAARIDVCSLANNHVLDWGYAGLTETLETLKKAGIKCVGAGMDLREAASPTVVEVTGKGRVVTFAYGSPSSGVALSWRALEGRAGVNLLRAFSEEALSHVREQVLPVKQAGDIVVVSQYGFQAGVQPGRKGSEAAVKPGKAPPGLHIRPEVPVVFQARQPFFEGQFCHEGLRSSIIFFYRHGV